MGATKLKTSVTISEDVLEEIDRVAGEPGQRSAFLERAARDYLERLRRKERDARELAIFNANRESLERDIADVLTYQVIPEEP